VPDAAGEAWAFCIHGALPGLNEYVTACRTNARVGARFKRDAENVVRIYARTHRPPTFDGPVFVRFAWHERDRRRDADNVAFAKKFILDALVDLGVLPDDSRKYVTGFADEFHLDRQSPRVVVTIERTPA
jgi:Holliday junction resolvase RusA-like endonuclease